MALPIEPLTDPAPVAEDLTGAILDALRAALVGPGPLTWAGLDLAEPGQPLPYAVALEPDEADSNLNTGGDLLADGHVNINVYAATKRDAIALGRRVAAVLQDAPLRFAAGTLVYLRGASRSAALDPDPAPGGGDCWQESRVFHFMYSYAYVPDPEGG